MPVYNKINREEASNGHKENSFGSAHLGSSLLLYIFLLDEPILQTGPRTLIII